jgi:hypothetical protein
VQHLAVIGQIGTAEGEAGVGFAHDGPIGGWIEGEMDTPTAAIGIRRSEPDGGVSIRNSHGHRHRVGGRCDTGPA